MYMAKDKNPSMGGSSLLRRSPFCWVDILWELRKKHSLDSRESGFVKRVSGEKGRQGLVQM